MADVQAHSVGLAQPTLPPELIHMMFDYLPKSALSACSLLSRKWQRWAQPLLFRTVTIRQCYGNSDIDSFLRFCRSSTPGLKDIVRELILHGVTSRMFEEERQHIKIDVSGIIRVLKELPGLRVLELGNFVVQCIDVGVLAQHQPRPLDELRLSSIQYSLPDLFRYELNDNIWATEDEIEGDDTNDCALVRLFGLFTSVGTLRLRQVEDQWDYASEGPMDLFLPMARAARRKLPPDFQIQRLISSSPRGPKYGAVGNEHEVVLELLKGSACRSLQAFESHDITQMCNALLYTSGQFIQELRLTILYAVPEPDEKVSFHLCAANETILTVLIVRSLAMSKLGVAPCNHVHCLELRGFSAAVPCSAQLRHALTGDDDPSLHRYRLP